MAGSRRPKYRPSRARDRGRGKPRRGRGGAGFWWVLIVLALAGGGAWYAWHLRNGPSAQPLPPVAPVTPVGPGTDGGEIEPPLVPPVVVHTNPPPDESPKVRVSTNMVRVPNRPATSAPPDISVELPSPTNAPPSRPRPPGRPVRDPYEAQVALYRRGLSSGSLDGSLGSQTRAALMAFQKLEGLSPTGQLDAATRERLTLTSDTETWFVVTQYDLDNLRSVPSTWLGKSNLDRIGYETILEQAAETGHAHPALIRKLNPTLDWANISPGTSIRIPSADYPLVKSKAALVRISLSQKTLRAFDGDGTLLCLFPCSIAQRVEKRPVGDLHVEVVIKDPDYTFNPDVFPESAEAKALNRKLILHAGPNNPVGVAWIGLSRPGYGIHGTPKPEEVGRTESHGCFRLANWNADYLRQLVVVGTPVSVEP